MWIISTGKLTFFEEWHFMIIIYYQCLFRYKIKMHSYDRLLIYTLWSYTLGFFKKLMRKYRFFRENKIGIAIQSPHRVSSSNQSYSCLKVNYCLVIMAWQIDWYGLIPKVRESLSHFLTLIDPSVSLQRSIVE